MKTNIINRPLLLVFAILLCLGMVRLGVWQLDRAEQKREILSQHQEKAQLPAIALTELLPQFSSSHRFRQVRAVGRYLADKSIFIDNQVHRSMVGYHLLTPFQFTDQSRVVLVNRGWVSIGQSRATLPILDTPAATVQIVGRLNMPSAQPPLWNNDFPISRGQVWQYLPIGEYAAQLSLRPLPLVLELAPDQPGSAMLIQQWQKIDNEWVAKHQGYAFQWFVMALVFMLACIVLLMKSLLKSPD